MNGHPLRQLPASAGPPEEDTARPPRRLQGWLAAVTAGATAAVAVGARAAAGIPPARAARSGFQATIVRTTGGIPHITARSFGSLGYGYGYAFASDNLCTMAEGYLTVEAQRARYLGPDGTYRETLTGDAVSNLRSDFFWRSVISRRVIAHLLSVRSGPGAVAPQVRELMAGYVAGYNRYLASVGGSKGVPDPTCRSKPWVKPITLLDAYLRVYQLADLAGQAAFITQITGAHPPAGHAPGARATASGRPAAAMRPLASGSGLGSNAIAIAAVTGWARPGSRSLICAA